MWSLYPLNTIYSYYEDFDNYLLPVFKTAHILIVSVQLVAYAAQYTLLLLLFIYFFCSLCYLRLRVVFNFGKIFPACCVLCVVWVLLDMFISPPSLMFLLELETSHAPMLSLSFSSWLYEICVSHLFSCFYFVTLRGGYSKPRITDVLWLRIVLLWVSKWCCKKFVAQVFFSFIRRTL